MTKQLVLEDVNVNVAVEEEIKPLLKNINLTINKGDFVTIIGTNGAGKSTLFNSITGDLNVSSGSVKLADKEITKYHPEKRARYISRVFQDPKLGTAPRMTVAENLDLASHRGERLTLASRNLKSKKANYKELAEKTGNGLELALDKPTEQLSGGQRQALSLLMATMKLPDLLLLDEHTAALDPKTSAAIMKLTNDIINQKDLTALMITHHLEDALKYGNRLIVLDHGEIVADYAAEEKAKLVTTDLLKYFG